MSGDGGTRHPVGVVGLGPMGVNLARNLHDRSFPVHLGNRTVSRTGEVVASVRDGPGRPPVTGHETLAALVAALPRPRRIIVLVAPDGTGAVLDELRDLVDDGDVVVDAGNSPFLDTGSRQERFAATGSTLLGAGVASGVDGARSGLSATVSGDPAAFDSVRDVLERVAVSVDDRTCCVYSGPGASGHLYKMVHNGVEYSQMQLVAEIVSVLRATTAASPADLAECLSRWNDELRSYVLRTAVDVLGHTDPETGAPFVDIVVDRAIQHGGSGRRAAESALHLGTPSTAFAESSLSWYLSCDDDQREAARTWSDRVQTAPATDPQGLTRSARNALAAAFLLVYTQAHRHVVVAAQRHGWVLDAAAVLHSWRGACIRSSVLDGLVDGMTDGSVDGEPGPAPTVLHLPYTTDRLAAWGDDLRTLCLAAVRHGVAAPCLQSTLAYIDGLGARRSSAAVVQALRSRLGGSPYERVDRDGPFRTAW